MEKKRISQELESGTPLTFRVCKAVFEDADSYAVVYGIKGVDEVGNIRVHIREVSGSLLRVQRLVRRLNANVFSQTHLMDLIDQYLDETEEEERQEKGESRVLSEPPVWL